VNEISFKNEACLTVLVSKGSTSDSALTLAIMNLRKLATDLGKSDLKIIQGSEIEESELQQIEHVDFVVVFDELKRTKKTLLALVLGTPILKSSFLAPRSRKRFISDAQASPGVIYSVDKSYLWLNDTSLFKTSNGFTTKNIWQFAQSRWLKHRKSEVDQ